MEEKLDIITVQLRRTRMKRELISMRKIFTILTRVRISGTSEQIKACYCIRKRPSCLNDIGLVLRVDKQRLKLHFKCH